MLTQSIKGPHRGTSTDQCIGARAYGVRQLSLGIASGGGKAGAARILHLEAAEGVEADTGEYACRMSSKSAGSGLGWELG